MGISGKSGRILYQGLCYNVTPNLGDSAQFVDEITRFVINDSVQMRRYGHDKSAGWQAAVSGVRGLTITIDAMLAATAGGSGGITPNPGMSVLLELMPDGLSCSTLYTGFATVESVSYTTDIETGQPVSYTMTLASNGAWTGLGDNDANTCECGSSSGP